MRTFSLSLIYLLIFCCFYVPTIAQERIIKHDTIFIKNYITANKKSYLYSRPNIASKTKIKIPNDVMITTINKSGNFEYGSFSISSNKNYRGGFLVTDLKGIGLTPPIINKRHEKRKKSN